MGKGGVAVLLSTAGKGAVVSHRFVGLAEWICDGNRIESDCCSKALFMIKI